MSRFSLKTLQENPAPAGLAVAGLIAALLVLYVIRSGPVHALAPMPPGLVKLVELEKPLLAPDVAVEDSSGGMQRLRALRGRYVLLNLWAPWCAPCVKELPALAALKQAVPGDRLVVLAVNVGRTDAGETERFLAAQHASALGIWRDPNIAMERAFKAYGLPTTVLIAPDGRQIARAVGAAEWGTPEAIAYFKDLAGKKG